VYILYNKQIVKHRIRSLLDQIALSTGLLSHYERCMHRGLTILMYHRVLPLEQCENYPLPALSMPIEAFREQMKWLSERFTVLTVYDAFKALKKNRRFSKPIVAVTFDDGYYDNYLFVAPVLEEYGLRGTFFITSNFVASGNMQWFDIAAIVWKQTAEKDRKELLKTLYQTGTPLQKTIDTKSIRDWMEGLKKVNSSIRMDLIQKAKELSGTVEHIENFAPMKPHQIKNLHNHGHEIASHTVSHPILTQVSNAFLFEELNNSAKQLEEWTGTRPKGFCYPNGDYNNKIEDAVKQAGYDYACIIESNINTPEVSQTRLARLPITMQRTMGSKNKHNLLGFRSELSLIREIWRTS